MSATQHVAPVRTSTTTPAAPRAALPWQPSQPPSAAPAVSGAAADSWAATIARIPYLAQTQFGVPSIVYKPPTVLQLSEATGCSVSELAGAYNDLPVIRLSKESSSDAAVPLTAAETQSFDPFDYLQLVPIDETLELATNAVRARRPVPDAEETFWEADYWEKLKRIKQEQQERKEQRRQKKMARAAKKDLKGASMSAVGLPSAYAGGASNIIHNATLSASNSPSFMTPHSRQGSLSGHAGEADTSPTMANLESAQRQKKIAKGLLRRARYNESHNPSHAQPHTTRSASQLSLNSTSGVQPQPPAAAPQSVIRCRTRPRSYSITSQHTDARGFQYSISSAISESGRSALSDSLRTPPLLSINGVPHTKEGLMTSLEMELSMSGGVTKSGATTHSRNSAVTYGRGATPQISPTREEATPSQRSSRLRVRNTNAANAPMTPLSCDSKKSSPRLRGRDVPSQSKNANATTASAAGQLPSSAFLAAPQKKSQMGESCGSDGVMTANSAHAVLATPAASPVPAAEATPSSFSPGSPSPPPATQESPPTATTMRGAAAATDATAASTPPSSSTPPAPPQLITPSEDSKLVTPSSSGQGLPAVHAQRRPFVRSVDRGSSDGVVRTGPNSRCTTARPSPALRPQHTATCVAPTSGVNGVSATANGEAGSSLRGPRSGPLVPVAVKQSNTTTQPSSTSPPSPCTRAKSSMADAADASKPPTSLCGHPAVAMIPHPSRSPETPLDAPAGNASPEPNAQTNARPASSHKADAKTTVSDTATAHPTPEQRQRQQLERRGSTHATRPSPNASPAKATRPTENNDNITTSTLHLPTLTATSQSDSATSRATATTVPHSRTPTREVSISPRRERVIAVHAAAPLPPPPPAEDAELSRATTATATPTLSPSVSLLASQPPRGPTRPPTREGSAALNSPDRAGKAVDGASAPSSPLQPSPAPSSPLVQSQRQQQQSGHASSPPTPLKGSPQRTSVPHGDGKVERSGPTAASQRTSSAPADEEKPVQGPYPVATASTSTQSRGERGTNKASPSATSRPANEPRATSNATTGVKAGTASGRPTAATPAASKPAAKSSAGRGEAAPLKAKQEKKSGAACCTVM